MGPSTNRDEFVNFLTQRAQIQPDLYAVTYAIPSRPPEQGGLPPAPYTAIYGKPGDRNTIWYLGIDVEITYAFGGCAQTPETIADRRDRSKANDGFLLPPAPWPRSATRVLRQ